jgi:hypothetical protein
MVGLDNLGSGWLVIDNGNIHRTNSISVKHDSDGEAPRIAEPAVNSPDPTYYEDVLVPELFDDDDDSNDNDNADDSPEEGTHDQGNREEPPQDVAPATAPTAPPASQIARPRRDTRQPSRYNDFDTSVNIAGN